MLRLRFAKSKTKSRAELSQTGLARHMRRLSYRIGLTCAPPRPPLHAPQSPLPCVELESSQIQFASVAQLICPLITFPVNSSIKLECEKLSNEKTEMQRHYVMVSRRRGRHDSQIIERSLS